MKALMKPASFLETTSFYNRGAKIKSLLDLVGSIDRGIVHF